MSNRKLPVSPVYYQNNAEGHNCYENPSQRFYRPVITELPSRQCMRSASPCADCQEKMFVLSMSMPPARTQVMMPRNPRGSPRVARVRSNDDITYYNNANNARGNYAERAESRQNIYYANGPGSGIIGWLKDAVTGSFTQKPPEHTATVTAPGTQNAQKRPATNDSSKPVKDASQNLQEETIENELLTTTNIITIDVVRVYRKFSDIIAKVTSSVTEVQEEGYGGVTYTRQISKEELLSSLDIYEGLTQRVFDDWDKKESMLEDLKKTYTADAVNLAIQTLPQRIMCYKDKAFYPKTMEVPIDDTNPNSNKPWEKSRNCNILGNLPVCIDLPNANKLVHACNIHACNAIQYHLMDAKIDEGRILYELNDMTKSPDLPHHANNTIEYYTRFSWQTREMSANVLIKKWETSRTAIKTITDKYGINLTNKVIQDMKAGVSDFKDKVLEDIVNQRAALNKK